MTPVGWTVRPPTPRAAVALSLGFLGLGSVIGAAAQPGRSLAGAPPAILAPGPVAAVPAPLPVVVPPTAGPEPEAATPEPAIEAVVPEPEAVAPAEPAAEPEPAPEPAADEEEQAADENDAPAAPEPPEIRHVWLVVLPQIGFDAAYGPTPLLPSLPAAAARGALLTGVHAVAHGSLPGGVALLSGQGPNPSLLADCPTFSEVLPGTLDEDGLVRGDGCVFGPQVPTVLDQLTEAERPWRVYAQDAGKAPVPAPPEPPPTTCRHPALGAPDPWQGPRAGDRFRTPRTPAVYFRAVIDAPDCAQRVVDLDALDADLALPAERAPAFSYLSPDADPAGADAQVADLLKRITASAAYADGGLVIVTSDQGAAEDAGGCCRTAAFPNLPGDAPTADSVAGGGRTGALLLSEEVRQGYVDDTPLDQFSLLRLVQDRLGLRPLGHAKVAPDVPPELFQPE